MVVGEIVVKNFSKVVCVCVQVVTKFVIVI